jgi:hypothetical protein
MGCPCMNPGWRYDHSVWTDLLPFLGQDFDYLGEFPRARGSVRPMTKAMVR